MATVPTVNGPSVTLGAAPSAYQRAPQGLGGAGQVRAQQLGQLGQIAREAAGQVADIEQRARDEADHVRVDDVLNQLKERETDLTFGQESGFTNLRGIAALERPSGKPLAEEYTETLRKAAADLGGGLATERQKRMFGLRANDVISGFRGQVMRYEGQQYQTYKQSVREGTIANRQDEVSRYWNDPVRIDDALMSIDAAVADLGRSIGGMSAEWIEARQREEVSKAITGAVSGALDQNNFTAADALLAQYGDRMTASDLVRSRGVVDKHLDAGIALQAATSVVRRMQPAMQPTDFDRVIGITLQAESGGQRFGPGGGLLTSPAGAKGEMQVMDGTNLDPGFGVTPARDDSPDERARVGRDYLGAMVKRYGGNLAQAWAAYNAGPTRVDTEVRDAEKRGVPGAWLSNMPAETQAYVKKNIAAYESGGGRPPAPTLRDVHAAVRERVGEGNPNRLKLALDESTRQFEEFVKAIKQREDEATANAQRWLAANNGRWTMMPASLRSAVPPGEVDNLLNFGERVARGEDRTNPAVYQRLSDPAFLRSLSEDEFYTLSTRELSQADRKRFADERGKTASGASGDKPGDLNTSAIKTLLDTRLRELDMDPTPKDGSDDAMRVGAVRRFVDQSLLAAQAAAGKKFNDAEVARHIDGLFAQTDVVKGWFGDTSVPLMTMQAGDIPSDVRSRLRDDFRAAGVDDPTDGQILGAYLTAKTAVAQARRIVPLPATKTK